MKIILLSITGVLLAQVTPVPLSEVHDVVPAFTLSGKITLPAARLKVEIDSPKGKKRQSELTVIYDPGTGYYLWNHMSSNPDFPEHTGSRINTLKQPKLEVATVSDAAGLIQFDFGGALFAKASRGRASNLSAAVTASIDEFRLEVAAFGGISLNRYLKLIPVSGLVIGFDAKIPPGYKPIGRDFLSEYNPVTRQFDMGTIVSVTKQGNNYRLVLRKRVDVEVIVDQNLDLVSAQQLTQPAK